MKHDVTILDCTLRDGGYVNDWNFGHDVIQSIYRRLDDANVDYIEVGFLDERRPFDINRTIFPDTRSLDKVFAGVEKKKAIPVAMIDFGTCSIDNLAPANETFIDGIRVIFKKEKIDQALPFCEKIKEKGYKLFIQAISITAYSDSEMLEYVKRINKIKPYAFSIVDTYGLLDNKSMARYFYLIDNNLDPEIIIGYHEHNNFQLGFSNTAKFLEKDTKRMLCADSTVYGMGKSAGNCPTELLTMQLNEIYEKNYNLAEILEIIDTYIYPIYITKFWGYKLDFYISSMQRCHPSYVKYLIDKKTLSITSINNILSTIPQEKKLLYDGKWIESAYYAYQSNEIDDKKSYEELIGRIVQHVNKDIILVGPGASTSKWISNSNKSDDCMLICVNFYTRELDADLIFVSNSKRYTQIMGNGFNRDLSDRIVITSNITPISGESHITLNYASLLNSNSLCSDNSLLLLLKALIKADVKKVKLMGFDGFDDNVQNYFKDTMSFNNINAQHYNEQLSKELSEIAKSIEIEFLSPSKYVIFK